VRYHHLLFVTVCLCVATLPWLTGCGGGGDASTETSAPTASVGQGQPGTGTTPGSAVDPASPYAAMPTEPNMPVTTVDAGSPYAALPQPEAEAYQPAATNSPYASLTESPTAELYPTLGAPDIGAANPAATQVVQLNTNYGVIKIQLDSTRAQQTVANFLRYVDSGHYTGTVFHEVLPGETRVVIGGAYTQQLQEKPTTGLTVQNEARNGRKNLRGTVAMARRPDRIHSSTCHFFINVTDNEVLDHKNETAEGYGYCVFGDVIEGMDVVDAISASPVQAQGEFQYVPIQTALIQSASRVQ